MALTWNKQNAMTRAEIDKFLAEKLVARVATLRKDGSVHITPLWYAWDGNSLWLILGKERQHVTNLMRNPTISVIIDKDIRPQEGNLKPGAQAVLLRGKAQLLTGDRSQVEATTTILTRYLGPKGKEYVQAALEDGSPGKNRVVVKLRPGKIVAWDFAKQPFTY